MAPVFSDWLTGTLSDEGWGLRDDKIVQFALHYFLYFPIFHLKYYYIFPIFCPSEFLYSYFFVKKVTDSQQSEYRLLQRLLNIYSRQFCGLKLRNLTVKIVQLPNFLVVAKRAHYDGQKQTKLVSFFKRN